MLSFFVCPVIVTSLVWHRVWNHNRVPLGPDILYITTCIYLASIHTYRVLLPLLLLLLLLLCVVILLVLLKLLLLFVIVCRMAKFVAGSLNLIPVLSFSSFNLYFKLSLGSTVAFTASICLQYILGNYGHARRRGGRQPAAKPFLYIHRYMTGGRRKGGLRGRYCAHRLWNGCVYPSRLSCVRRPARNMDEPTQGWRKN